jgi:hypothetical protein
MGRLQEPDQLVHRPRADYDRADGGMGKHETHGHFGQRQPGLAGYLRETVHGGELGLVAGEGHVVALREPFRAPARVVFARAEAPGEPAAGERAPGEDAHAVAPAHLKHVRLDPAHEHRIGRLLGGEALVAPPLCAPLRLDDHPGRERRAPEVAHLPAVDEVGERRERLVDVRGGLGPVDLVKVDVVSAEPAQARLALGDHPAARVALPVGALAHLPVDFGGEHHLFPPGGAEAGQPLAHYFL